MYSQTEADKAFDRVDRLKLLHELKDVGVSGKFFEAVRSLIEGKEYRTLHKGTLSSSSYSNTHGLPQGVCYRLFSGTSTSEILLLGVTLILSTYLQLVLLMMEQ